MSHFSVMLVTDKQVSEEEIGKIMQPWHEFECTGENDQYVQEVDVTEEYRGYYKEIEDTTTTFEEFCTGDYEILPPDGKNESHKYGYVVLNDEMKVEKVILRTNTNSRWDYWTIGGRYRSKLQVKEGTLAALSTDPSWEWRGKEDIPQGYDQARVGDIDLDKMKQEARDYRLKSFNECRRRCALSVSDMEKALQQQKPSRQVWLTIPEETRPQGREYIEWLRENGYSLLADALGKNFSLPDLEADQSVEEWIEAAPLISSFAVVKDGIWYERGSMGWWAMVSDEDDEWESKLNKLFESFDDDKWITFLDCHI